MFISYGVCLHPSFVFDCHRGKTWRQEQPKMPPKRKAGNGKKRRQDTLNNAKRDRNWTDLETEAFCEILADPKFSFSTTLETKALKKQANKEVLEEIQRHLKTSFEDPGFLEENQNCLDE